MVGWGSNEARTGLNVISPKIDELFSQALSGGYEDQAPWQAIRALHRIGTREVFERAVELCKAPDPLFRARGADVLAQLGKTADYRTNAFPEESYSKVTELVQRETELQPLSAGIAALGHIDNPLAVPIIASFSSHPSAEVRYSVAFALSCFPNDLFSAETLRRLTEDTDEDVRDWATFGLGVLGDIDSDEVRESLFRRLEDSSEDVREEAMVGLGKRRDQRVLSALMAALDQPTMTVRVIEAAYLMLSMEHEKEDWDGSAYAAALRERFPPNA
jgi:HEAT repeat protein